MYANGLRRRGGRFVVGASVRDPPGGPLGPCLEGGRLEGGGTLDIRQSGQTEAIGVTDFEEGPPEWEQRSRCRS